MFFSLNRDDFISLNCFIQILFAEIFLQCFFTIRKPFLGDSDLNFTLFDIILHKQTLKNASFKIKQTIFLFKNNFLQTHFRAIQHLQKQDFYHLTMQISIQFYLFQIYKCIIIRYKFTNIQMNIIGALNEPIFSYARSHYPKTTLILTIFGVLIILKKVLNTLKFIFEIILRRRRNLRKRYGENSWAFITGSSDGIGKALAFSLAKQGFNIILSARTKSKLENVRDQLLKKFPLIEVKIIPADYKNSYQPQFIQDIMNQLNGLNISILVNNVGVDVLNYYHELSPEQISDLIKINCFPVCFLNRQFIPIFKKRLQINPNIRSAIINVSSVAGQIPMPFHNVYSASKVFVDCISKTLSYQNPEIDIISLRPSQVSTPMTFHKKLDLFTITAEQCAQGCLNDLGHTNQTNGYWTHKLQSKIYSSLPQSVFNYFWMKFFAPEFMKERSIAMKQK